MPPSPPSFEERITFREACGLLHCTSAWLTLQIDTGRVRFTLVDNKGQQQYSLFRTDVEALATYSVPVKIKQASIVEAVPYIHATLMRRAELHREAQELGMTLEAYAEELGIEF